MTVMRYAPWLSHLAVLVCLLLTDATASAQSPSATTSRAETSTTSGAARRPQATARTERRSRSTHRTVSTRMNESSVMLHNRRMQQEQPDALSMENAETLEGPLFYDDMGGDMMMGDVPFEAAGGGCSSDCGGGCATGCNVSCGTNSCNSCCLLPWPILSFSDLEVFSGSHGFTGPANLGSTGSFGFHEGINVGVPLPCYFGGALAGQIGAQAVHSNFSGADFTEDERNQVFVTGGLFRRVDWGLQGGLVLDYMHDDWYVDADLTQLRGELSWMYPSGHELGVWFTSGTADELAEGVIDLGVPQAIEQDREVNDLYAFFYRHHFKNCPGAEARFYAGFSSESDGLIGSDVRLCISSNLAVESGYTYLVPEDSPTAFVEESWNLAINLVWYPGCRPNSGSYSRPLFKVANNGSFMFDIAE